MSPHELSIEQFAIVVSMVWAPVEKVPLLTAVNICWDEFPS